MLRAGVKAVDVRESDAKTSEGSIVFRSSSTSKSGGSGGFIGAEDVNELYNKRATRIAKMHANAAQTSRN